MSSPKEQRDLIQSMAFNGIPVEYNGLIDAGTIIVIGIRGREVRKIVANSREDVEKFKDGKPGIERVVWVPPDLVTQNVVQPMIRPNHPWEIERRRDPWRRDGGIMWNANEARDVPHDPNQPRCEAKSERKGLSLVA